MRQNDGPNGCCSLIEVHRCFIGIVAVTKLHRATDFTNMNDRLSLLKGEGTGFHSHVVETAGKDLYYCVIEIMK